MNLPTGIDLPTWRKALENYGHPWREGQRCNGCSDHRFLTLCERPNCRTQHRHDPHDIPMPAVTDELLMRMLKAMACREIMKPDCKGCVPCDVIYNEPELWFDGSRWHCRTNSWAEEFVGKLDVAIILATASLEEVMLTKEERLAHIERSLNLLKNTGGTDKDWMLKVIREQDAALAEARDYLAGVKTTNPYWYIEQIAKWLDKHPAPAKEL